MAPKSFTFVRVPATNDDAMEERTLPVPDTLEANIGCLTSALQQYFREHGGTTTEAGEAAMMSAVKERMAQQKQKMIGGADDPSAPPTQIDQKMLSQLTASQTVDIIQLLPATKASGYVGVNMYVDDKGVAKESPRNARATAICAQAGLSVEVRGDAFISKVWDDQEGFERHDLLASDLSSDAEWITTARRLNEGRADPKEAYEQLTQATAAPAVAR